ncbi:T-complex protein 11 [Seminavis robusta]|uniref:T-complex protein 11 n=1 Tax=Seminavis robusta TaxID=568900 RepID=A0A9N8HEJ6_9STRA|nr:T-complex protein 11 [Seminavis robusta]|eukprot:Sro477_g150740.1 T-complex protein 11 (517) ;mRNA; f:22915-24465
MSTNITPDNNTSLQETDLWMSRLDPALIHRVLLTDPADFPSLASSTKFTLSFAEFRKCLVDDKIEALPADMVVKRAVHDHIIQSLRKDPENLKPLTGLLLELHGQCRALIPNRKDLHSILDDEHVKTVTTLQEILPLISKAASSLAQLESESRATTTLELLNSHKSTDNKDTLFWVAVVFYLLYKAELCQAEKQDFYLVHVWAPQIHKEGPDIERTLYQQQFGKFEDADSSPATRQWIQSLVQAHLAANPQAQEVASTGTAVRRQSSLTESVDDRKALVRAGWIDDILFRDQTPLNLPEIFARDHNGLQTLREMTRLAVAGCALALQACSAAGVANPKGKKGQQSLWRALQNRGIPPDLYERNVVEQVVALAQDWSVDENSKTILQDEEAKQQLAGRVVAVLRGQDPVLKLLDGRTKQAVREALLLLEEEKDTTKGHVSEMRTGRQEGSIAIISGDTQQAPTVVEKLFCQRGLAFSASELAMVAKLAGKVVNLAIDLYWEVLLDRLVLDACNERHI